MRKGGGKNKGSAQERRVCELLSLWISAGLNKDIFWRASMSGGRATVIHKRGGKNRQCGDIVAVAPEGHVLTDKYLFECKHYKNIRLETFIINNRGPLASWWKQACKQAKQHGREPVLIAKQNNMPTIVVTRLSSMFNQKPVARSILVGCNIGMLDRILKEPFADLKPIKKRTFLSFPGDDDLELK